MVLIKIEAEQTEQKIIAAVACLLQAVKEIETEGEEEGCRHSHEKAKGTEVEVQPGTEDSDGASTDGGEEPVVSTSYAMVKLPGLCDEVAVPSAALRRGHLIQQEMVDAGIAPDRATANGTTKRWYSVSAGRMVGVYDDWEIAASFIQGVSSPRYKRHNSHSQACAAFDLAWDMNTVHLKL